MWDAVSRPQGRIRAEKIGRFLFRRRREAPFFWKGFFTNNMSRSFFTPRWLITTLLVVAAVAVMARLGIWQLDRLQQRRAFNTRVQAQIDSPPLDLNQALVNGQVNPADLPGMEYRQVVVRGTYHFDEQVGLRNQIWESQPGYQLLTPLAIDGTPYVVLVDRGWVPMQDRTMSQWAKYDPSSAAQVSGQISLSQSKQVFGAKDPALAPGQTRLEAWNRVDLDRLSQQVQGQLLPVYIMQAPPAGAAQSSPPYRALEQPDLTEGPHMSYALQWFSFAAILGFGYPFFVRKQLREDAAEKKSGEANQTTAADEAAVGDETADRDPRR